MFLISVCIFEEADSFFSLIFTSLKRTLHAEIPLIIIQIIYENREWLKSCFSWSWGDRMGTFLNLKTGPCFIVVPQSSVKEIVLLIKPLRLIWLVQFHFDNQLMYTVKFMPLSFISILPL